MQKSLEQLEEERKQYSTVASDKIPTFEALEKTVPPQQVATPPSQIEMDQVDKDFQTDMRLADMLEMSMSDVADLREPLEKLEKDPMGPLEGLIQDPYYKIRSEERRVRERVSDYV